ncbi:MAG TPA: hypothetical protein VFM21_03450 [Terriglobia bacterium]|nr:hypothetical protein [Terriglobia bacterium]
MNRENDKFVDQLLDASIGHCAGAEPRAGLEGRILAVIAARQRSANRNNWAWGLAAAALAAVAIVIAARYARRASLPTPQPASVAVARPQSAAPPVAIAPERIPVKTVRASRFTAQRPQQFPTPAPLSEQEKLLLLYVKQTPKSALAASPEDAGKDMEISALNIAALEIKELPSTQEEK